MWSAYELMCTSLPFSFPEWCIPPHPTVGLGFSIRVLVSVSVVRAAVVVSVARGEIQKV